MPNHSSSPFVIIPPTKDENRYRYRIQASGNDYSAYLTYQLPRKTESDDRSVLMVADPQPFIGSEHKVEYDRLVELVMETVGRFTGVKNIVNRLADNELNLPNAG